MNRIKLVKKCVIFGIMIILSIFFINTCMMTKIPDEITILHESEPIIVYTSREYSFDPGNYHFTRYDIIPEYELQIVFERSIFWPDNNNDGLYIRGHLFTKEPVDKLYIKELSYNIDGKNYVLIENAIFNSAYNWEKRIIVDEHNNPIMVNGNELYFIRFHFSEYKFNGELKLDWGNKYIGEEKEIELIQIYSIDDKYIREEKHRYRVICGGKKFDFNRPMTTLLYYLFPP